MREPETLLRGAGQPQMASGLLRPMAAFTIGVAVASCGLGFDPGEVRDQGLDTATFTGALADQYVRLAEAEAAEGDWRDADVFIDRARRIAAGETIGPEPVDGRDLPAESVPQVAEGRARLLSALDRGGRIFAVAEAARAQVYFDCWVQELEEQEQPWDVDDCRNRFTMALRQTEELSRGDVLVLLPDLDGGVGTITVASDTTSVTLNQAGDATLVRENAEAPRSPVAMDDRTLATLFGDAIAAQPEAPARFLLYFAGGGTALTAESAGLLPDIEAEIRRRDAPNITVIGHTDTVGPAALNARLAVNRAEAVREQLLATPVDPAAIEATSYGESLPLVQTPDNVDEPLNRRVEVIVR